MGAGTPVAAVADWYGRQRIIEDECFYVLEGKVAIVCGGEWLGA
jgi:hypothetical protein